MKAIYKKIFLQLIVCFSVLFLSSITTHAQCEYFSDDFESGLTQWLYSGADWALNDSVYRSAGHSISDSPQYSGPRCNGWEVIGGDTFCLATISERT